MDKLTFISDSLREGRISLNADKLIVVNSTSTGEELHLSDVNIIKEDGSSLFRPIRCSELVNKLLERGWNNLGTKYSSKDADGSIRNLLVPGNLTNTEQTTGVLTINTELMENPNGVVVGVPVSRGVTQADCDAIDEEYANRFGKMDGVNEVWFYRSTKDSIDLPTGTKVMSIIDCNSSIYTNTVNLNQLIHHSSGEKLSAKVDITIQYTKCKRAASIELTNPLIYSRDLTFEAFNYSNGQLIVNNLMETIDRDVVLEFINGIIKVTPLTENVLECIIRNCTVTYGNIK